MIAPLAKVLDWSAVQATTLMLPANFYRNDPRLEEALEFLNGPESFPNESQPSPARAWVLCCCKPNRSLGGAFEK